jgi:DNA processing protein
VKSRGPHKLIKDGAKLVENIEDILQEIVPALMPAPSTRTTAITFPLEPHEALLVGIFESDPLHVDTLIAKSGLTPARVLEVLLGLELKGIITQLPGTYFALTGEGREYGRK